MTTLYTLSTLLILFASLAASLLTFAAYRTERAKRIRLQREHVDTLLLYDRALDKATDDWLIEKQRPRVMFAQPCACRGLPDARRNVSAN